MRSIKTIGVLMVLAILISSCGNKEKKNVLGSGGSTTTVVNTDGGSNGNEGTTVVAKPDAIAGVVRWQSSSAPGLKTPTIDYASGFRISLVNLIPKKTSFAYEDFQATDSITTIVTDNEGKFEFSNLSPGNYVITSTDIIDGLLSLTTLGKDYGLNLIPYVSTKIILEKSSAIVIDVVLYPPYNEKPPIPNKSSINESGNLYTYVHTSNLGVGYYIYQTTYNDFRNDGVGISDFYNDKGNIMGGTRFRYKFIRGIYSIEKTNEKSGINTYTLYTPTIISEWSDTVFIP